DYTFSFSGSARAVASVQAYGNVDTTHPIDAVATATETALTTHHKTPPITTTHDGDVLMAIFGVLNPHEPASLSPMRAHERVDRSSGNSGSWGVGLGIYDSDPRSGPATESERAVVSSSATDTATMTLFALRPKPPMVDTAFGAAFSPHTTARFDDLINQW